jgi:carbohydrate-selective porin OprB
MATQNYSTGQWMGSTERENKKHICFKGIYKQMEAQNLTEGD